MNARTVSLPDLVTERKRNTALSLSEGFAGARREGALAATAENWCPRPGAGAPMVGQREAGKELDKVLPIYYRTRQLALATEKSGHRMPQKMQSELRFLEKAVARELRPANKLFFQRFDDLQLDRFLRAMPFLRLSSGRWLFGGESLGAQWPDTKGDRSFLLLQGHIVCYADPAGTGKKTDVHTGAIFCEKSFMLGDESMQVVDYQGSAHCEEPCIVGMITTDALEAAFSDRVFGNARIAQTIRNVPAMARICKPDEEVDKIQQAGATASSGGFGVQGQEESSSAVITALRELSKQATAVHMPAGVPLISAESLDDCVTVVCKGALEIRGDIKLKEKLEQLPPKKVRMRVHIKTAQNLAGGSIFDTLDPYVKVKCGDFKMFQTAVMWNAGNNAKFDHHGVLTYSNEENLENVVMDRDQNSADHFCGSGTIPCAELHDGWTGWVPLTRPKPGLLLADGNLEQPAGKIQITVNWDYEKVNPLLRKAAVKEWTDQELFILREQECWGHEHIMLQNVFMRTLEQAGNTLPYAIELKNIKVLGNSPSGGDAMVTCWKASKQRFLDFVKHTGREKPFLQACRVSALEKQSQIKELAKRLIRKWETEKETELLRTSMDLKPPVEEVLDPSRFRVAYRNMKAHVSVRNALNLSGGGYFDKLDPFAVLRFKGSKHTFKTCVLQDAGADPVWDNEGPLLYGGETTLEITVWDYDKYSANDLIGTGTLNVEQFCSGFEGMVPISRPGDQGKKKKKTLKQMMIIIGIQWPAMDMNSSIALQSTNASAALTGVGESLRLTG